MCPATCIVVALLVGSGLGLSGLPLHQLVLFGALPPEVLNFMQPEKFHQETQKVVSVVLLGKLGSILIIPSVPVFLL